jgi:type IV secretory pathway protease TraF
MHGTDTKYDVMFHVTPPKAPVCRYTSTSALYIMHLQVTDSADSRPHGSGPKYVKERVIEI